jgi:hypothetical protein
LIEEAAKRGTKKLNTVSMGQGREEFAQNFIAHSKAKGEWVLLQNYHLSLRYMETLFEMYKADALNAALAKADAGKEPEKPEPGAKRPEKSSESHPRERSVMEHHRSASTLPDFTFAVIIKVNERTASSWTCFDEADIDSHNTTSD